MVPVGTAATIWVEVQLVTTAVMPLKKVTVLFAGVGSKFAPVMVMEVPTGALAGEKPVIAGGGTTVKLDAEVAPWTTSVVVTVIGPVTAPWGTVVTIWVDVLLVTVAATPLEKTTVLFAGVGSKLLPVMVTDAPTGALAGVKPAMVGAMEDPQPARKKRRKGRKQKLTIDLRQLVMDYSFCFL